MDERFHSVGNEPLSEIENSVTGNTGSIGENPYELDTSLNDLNLKYRRSFDIVSIDTKNIHSFSLPRYKVIIGDDDREESSVMKYPYNCIALLIIYDKDDNEFFGSGFFISKRCVITAGHCVFNNNSWVKEIKVIPGAIGTKAPFGHAKSKIFKSVKGWTVSKDRNFDYGSVILNNDDLYQNIHSYFGYKVQSEKDQLIELSGYPMDKNGKQWKSKGKISKLSPYRIYYELDTLKGNSGSPIFINEENNWTAIGVHTYGETPTNSSIRLNNVIINRWHEWSNL
ncbi:MAG: trypsin-like peptidase domain-containing protein [Mariniphaga sp.]|nr:trypsin-like peptidase domain-containing protein [Mariniphaga sp.]